MLHTLAWPLTVLHLPTPCEDEVVLQDEEGDTRQPAAGAAAGGGNEDQGLPPDDDNDYMDMMHGNQVHIHMPHLFA